MGLVTFQIRIKNILVLVIILSGFTNRVLARSVNNDEPPSCMSIIGASVIDHSKLLAGTLMEKVAGHFQKEPTLSDLLSKHESLDVDGFHGDFLGSRQVRELTSEANRALTVLLKNPEYAEQIGYNLHRMGLLANTIRNPDLSKYLILARNKDVDISELKSGENHIEDSVLRHYLTQLKKKSDKDGSGISKIRPEKPDVRVAMLRSMISESLADLDKSYREKSIKTLDLALTELGKLDWKGQLTADSIEALLSQFGATSEFEVIHVNVPDWAKAAAEMVPLAPIALKIWQFASEAFYQNSNLSSVRRDAIKTDRWHKKIPGTLRLVTFTNDFKNLGVKADAFVLKYSKPDAGEKLLYSSDFAHEFLTAYPEILEYFVDGETDVTMNNHHLGVDSFSEYHPEVKKVLFRISNFFAILNGVHKAFPQVSAESFSLLRQHIINDLHLADSNGAVNRQQIDLILTSFVTSALGKAHNPTVDSIDRDYGISEKIGQYNYFHRALYLLHHSRLLSYSFARQSVSNQKFIVSFMNHNYENTLNELLSLEAPSKSFDLIDKMDLDHVNFIFYQYLLSESKESHHGMTITSDVLEKWFSLKSIFVLDIQEQVSAEVGYDRYVKWLLAGTTLDIHAPLDRITLRLNSMMGLPSSKIMILKKQIATLNLKQQQQFIYYLDNDSIFVHRASDLFRECLIARQNMDHSVEDSIGDFINIFTNVLTAVGEKRSAAIQMKSSKKILHLYLKPLVEELQNRQGNAKSLSSEKFDLHVYEYGIVVHPAMKP
jgi:hypothetical protein